MDDSSNKAFFKTRIIDLKGDEFVSLVHSADAFICAAGFECRAERVPLLSNITRNPILIAYTNGPNQNKPTFKKFVSRFIELPGYDVCELDLAHKEKFEINIEKSLRQLKNIQNGRIVLDISGLPNFAICTSIIKIRQIFPTLHLTILYTEAEEYFPQKRDFERIKRLSINEKSDMFREYLSTRAVNMFMPSMFSGVTLGHNDTCLIVFAGYEPHRTLCAVESTNPSKLVLIYGEPERPDLKWRLELSQLMHRGIDRQLMKTEEVCSTFDVCNNLDLLIEYYNYLYDDHVLCVCPINSKIQSVAAALAWERYPDIQLNFPVPAEYLPKRFSLEWRNTFVIDLGTSPIASRFQLNYSP